MRMLPSIFPLLNHQLNIVQPVWDYGPKRQNRPTSSDRDTATRRTRNRKTSNTKAQLRPPLYRFWCIICSKPTAAFLLQSPGEHLDAQVVLPPRRLFDVAAPGTNCVRRSRVRMIKNLTTSKIFILEF